MGAHDFRQAEQAVALLRQVPRGVWVAVAAGGVLLLLALAWALVVAAQWLLSADPALVGQAAAVLGQGVPEAVQQAEAMVPGVVEPVRQAVPGMAGQVDQWIPGAGAYLEQAASVLGGTEPAAEPAEDAAAE
jgi:hypothetical protein